MGIPSLVAVIKLLSVLFKKEMQVKKKEIIIP